MSYLDNYGNKVVRQTLELAGQNVGYTSVLQYPEQLHPYVYAQMIADNISFTLLEAEKSREFADSYRNFRVGSAALAVYRRGEQMRKSFVHGANAKPISGSDIINVHAEHTILSMVETGRQPTEHTHHVPLIGIIGDLQADQQSGTDTVTLHPCGICREVFQEEGSPIDNTSLVVTANT
jgi:cytidine deaminase